MKNRLPAHFPIKIFHFNQMNFLTQNKAGLPQKRKTALKFNYIILFLIIV